MEMNTRLQVEHPVTEAVTGLDLVEWQFRVAAGEPLPLSQGQITLSGHAVEARLYAEDPTDGRFLPSIGRIEHLRLPAAIRIDAGVEAGGEASPYYDPMLAKLVVHAPDRASALARAAEACREVGVWPVKTNAGFLARCLAEPDFVAGAIDTGFVDRKLGALAGRPAPSPAALTAAARTLLPSMGDAILHGSSPWRALAGFRLNAAPDLSVRLFHDGAPVIAEAVTGASARPAFRSADDQIVVFEDGEAYAFADHPPSEADEDAQSDGLVRAPMPGKVTAVLVAAGDEVAKGQTLAVLEAMKMEYALAAPFGGTVVEVAVEAGEQTMEGRLVARVQAREAD
jgi:acetyl/propionyl-CoA carboxylase alpha subunit